MKWLKWHGSLELCPWVRRTRETGLLGTWIHFSLRWGWWSKGKLFSETKLSTSSTQLLSSVFQGLTLQRWQAEKGYYKKNQAQLWQHLLQTQIYVILETEIWREYVGQVLRVGIGREGAAVCFLLTSTSWEWIHVRCVFVLLRTQSVLLWLEPSSRTCSA